LSTAADVAALGPLQHALPLAFVGAARGHVPADPVGTAHAAAAEIGRQLQEDLVGDAAARGFVTYRAAQPVRGVAGGVEAVGADLLDIGQELRRAVRGPARLGRTGLSCFRLHQLRRLRGIMTPSERPREGPEARCG
jgi:hypothetical protein